MALQITDYTAALKEILLPFIRDNFPKDKIMLDQVKRNAGSSFINDEFIAPVRTSRHGGVVNLADDGNNLNAADGATTSRGTVGVKTVTGAFNITKLAVDASKTSQGAVEAALQFQAETLTSDFGRHINRQIYNGPSACIGQVLGSVGVGTFSIDSINSADIDDGRVVDYYGTINGDIAPNKYFAVGQILGVGTAAADLGTVASVTGTSVVVTGDPASVANDAIFLVDGSGEGEGTSEFNAIRDGLSSTTGTSTYAGLARNVQGWSPQFGSVSEALTLSRMEDSYLGAREYAQSGDRYVILVNKTLFKKYGDILTSMRRTVDKIDLIGGFRGLEFAAGDANVGVLLDYDVPDGEILVINLDTWTLLQVSDMNWLEDPNGGGLLRLQNTIQFQATLVWFANMMCLGPAANGRETRKTD